ncbi:MAG TPA: hypothetical protein DCE41_31940 [Cytophagales bacterium]|nr:hypothetical protein [Cytophagales bacterium]HAA18936.1 hypothetical protein [Cytophagales bacterium]HAP64309.1 hypothetical protein [Cytophagales bacterium]
MKPKYIQTNIPIDELKLDINNPRFAELYTDSKDENDLINYLLYTEAAVDIAKAISTAGEFYADRPLWIVKKNDSYTVRDGNRRCASVKALRSPGKFGLDLPKLELTQLPVLLYHDEKDVSERIRLEHTSSLFRQWGRIAKALELYRLYSKGDTIDQLTEIDSKPKDLLKLAQFYYRASRIGGEEFKKLLRPGKGKESGKTIIFERFFHFRKKCGYNFSSGDKVKINVEDGRVFKSYINSMIAYLRHDDTKITAKDFDKKKNKYLKELEDFGFIPKETNENLSTEVVSSKPNVKESTPLFPLVGGNTLETPSANPLSDNTKPPLSIGPNTSTALPQQERVKTSPDIGRHNLNPNIKSLIDETFKISKKEYPNGKIALIRISFECVLKYVLDETKKANGNPLSKSNHFRDAFFTKNHKRKEYTDFKILKKRFSELVIHTGVRKAFENFDLDLPHQIIHNYMVGGISENAQGMCDNLLPLIEFLLKEEEDFLSSLELSQL